MLAVITCVAGTLHMFCTTLTHLTSVLDFARGKLACLYVKVVVPKKSDGIVIWLCVDIEPCGAVLTQVSEGLSGACTQQTQEGELYSTNVPHLSHVNLIQHTFDSRNIQCLCKGFVCPLIYLPCMRYITSILIQSQTHNNHSNSLGIYTVYIYMYIYITVFRS